MISRLQSPIEVQRFTDSCLTTLNKIFIIRRLAAATAFHYGVGWNQSSSGLPEHPVDL
jgi:hypothetical protein